MIFESLIDNESVTLWLILKQLRPSTHSSNAQPAQCPSAPQRLLLYINSSLEGIRKSGYRMSRQSHVCVVKLWNKTMHSIYCTYG
jgi:hypothetical protein